jgi:hypothetical protein
MQLEVDSVSLDQSDSTSFKKKIDLILTNVTVGYGP